ncbi:MAG: phenylalanine--tRNA ligase subunit beta [Mariniblastus sp.]|nr:phenylalanine--tRNA ligase subunit beta [Mariniblastus sp.]
MIVSWKWLSQYVDLEMDYEDLVDRLTMSGLNHEGTEEIEGDQAIDLEVTSNRPDCLGHIGVAREIAVLYQLPLQLPQVDPPVTGADVSQSCQVEIECPELCYRYTARLVRNVQVGPSPDWLVDRLKVIGVASVNNVVDATNFVMFETGQPLHAFDFSKVSDGKIRVREPSKDEQMEAIDHRKYSLLPGMCVIADTASPLAIGGVMGGAESEVSESTTDVLIEAAHFNPLSVRNTARTLNLHSPSSFRFERSIDPEQLDSASLRCAEIILQIAGGELAPGVVQAGQPAEPPSPITLRTAELERILGIPIPNEFVLRTLTDLGLEITGQADGTVTAIPPSWRHDLTREIDLVEEVGRIYGYDKVPDTAQVPMVASHLPKRDRVLERVRNVLMGAGFDEALTASFVPEPWSAAISPWTDQPALISTQPMLGVLEKASQNIGAVDRIRRSLIPSLLEARRINEYRSNTNIELFETAKVYLPLGEQEIPDQPTMVSLVSGRDFFEVKAILLQVVSRLNPNLTVELVPLDHPLLDTNLAVELWVGEDKLGLVGQVSDGGKQQFRLRSAAVVAECKLDLLESLAVLVPLHHNQSPFPPISRDFNFVVDEGVRWSELESTVRQAAGELLENVEYRETFRDQEKDGDGKKRVLLSVTLRSPSETLTGEMADQVSRGIVSGCQEKLAAALLV